mmetsp:Transcript_9854/g.29763  ORF Transcript_9854/g.29763 Transcript_9854/m.29763 type:complete len:100 (+) Transcript_9854:2090-2389(+)
MSVVGVRVVVVEITVDANSTSLQLIIELAHARVPSRNGKHSMLFRRRHGPDVSRAQEWQVRGLAVPVDVVTDVVCDVEVEVAVMLVVVILGVTVTVVRF